MARRISQSHAHELFVRSFISLDFEVTSPVKDNTINLHVKLSYRIVSYRIVSYLILYGNFNILHSYAIYSYDHRLKMTDNVSSRTLDPTQINFLPHVNSAKCGNTTVELSCVGGVYWIRN